MRHARFTPEHSLHDFDLPVDLLLQHCLNPFPLLCARISTHYVWEVQTHTIAVPESVGEEDHREAVEKVPDDLFRAPFTSSLSSWV